MSFWLTVAGMVAVTFGSRYAGLALRTDLPDFWVRFLHFVPIAVFASLVTPSLEGNLGEWGIRVAAAAVAAHRGLAHAPAVGRDRRRDGGVLAAADPVLIAGRQVPESQRRRSRPIAANSAAPSNPAEPVGERPQQPAGEEDPRLGIGIAIGRHRTGRLIPPHHLGDEIVHFAHVRADVALDLLVLSRLGDALHPEIRQQWVRPRRALLGADVRERTRTGDRSRLELDRRSQLTPGLVEAREPQLLLRREVPVDDRLRDAGCAGDLRRRRARVAARAEYVERGSDDRRPPLGRGQPDLGGLAHAGRLRDRARRRGASGRDFAP